MVCILDDNIMLFFLLTIAATEQENDEHESLVSDEKPTLEPFEGKVLRGTCTNEKSDTVILHTLCS